MVYLINTVKCLYYYYNSLSTKTNFFVSTAWRWWMWVIWSCAGDVHEQHKITAAGTAEEENGPDSPCLPYFFLTKTPSATNPFAASKLEYQWFPSILQLSIHLDATSKPVWVLTPQILSEQALEAASKTLIQLSGIYAAQKH